MVSFGEVDYSVPVLLEFSFLLLRQKKRNKRKGGFFSIAPLKKKGSTLPDSYREHGSNQLYGAGIGSLLQCYLAFTVVPTFAIY